MSYSWKKNTFDTELFGFPIAKIEAVDSSADIMALLTDLRENAIAYAAFRISAQKIEIINTLPRHGFYIVDGVIAMELSLRDWKNESDTSHIRKAKSEDSHALYTISSESFTVSRFYNDPIFHNKKASIKKLYGKWAENALKGEVADDVFVYEEGGRVIGFIALQKNGHISLLAVDTRMQGKGVAKAMIRHALSYLKDCGVEKVAIETVVTNIPALRSYEGVGFRITDSFFTFAWHDNIHDNS